MYELEAEVEHKEEVKKSRFHVFASPVASVEEAMDFINSLSDDSANHNCWAYKVGSDYRFSDDGEPSGTAGKPILSAIENAELTNICILVVRWFGGVKLGTGGLCRAYGGSASRCLQLGHLVELIHKIQLDIRVPFELSNQLYKFVERHEFTKVDEAYESDGLFIELEIPQVERESVILELTEITSGKAKIVIKDEA